VSQSAKYYGLFRQVLRAFDPCFRQVLRAFVWIFHQVLRVCPIFSAKYYGLLTRVSTKYDGLFFGQSTKYYGSKSKLPPSITGVFRGLRSVSAKYYGPVGASDLHRESTFWKDFLPIHQVLRVRLEVNFHQVLRAFGHLSQSAKYYGLFRLPNPPSITGFCPQYWPKVTHSQGHNTRSCGWSEVKHQGDWCA
jgi:hypothetical protein